jgi:hypothetical protein
MSFQTIFEIQQSMTVNNRRMVGQQVARSGYITVAQYLTAVPWVFTIQPHAYLYYPQVRDIIQAIDNKDRQLPENIFFQSTNLSWFLKYQGDIPSASFTSVVLASTPVANTQTLSVTVPTGTGYAFKAGDFIMVNGYTYKVTANVTRASTPVSVSIHRPLIGLPASGTRVFIGNDCVFQVVAESCPTYTLNPMTDGAFVQWDSPFVFREYIV